MVKKTRGVFGGSPGGSPEGSPEASPESSHENSPKSSPESSQENSPKSSPESSHESLSKSSHKSSSRAIKRLNARPWQRFYYFFIFAAFMGFVYENLLDNLWYHHPWQWQGPLHGPWLVIYGAGGLLLLVLLEKLVKKKVLIGKMNIMPILIALLIFAIVCVVEYAGHWFLDTFFDFRPWDYTEKPFNLNGRICLEDSLRFEVLGLLELYVFLPVIDRLLYKISKRQNLILFIILVATFVIDIVYSALVMLQ